MIILATLYLLLEDRYWDDVPVPYLNEEELDSATFDLF